MDQELEDFLEHHGVKGMHWGIRNLDRVSRVARGTAKRSAILAGKGARGSFKFAKQHPKSSASIAAGAIFAAGLLSHKINAANDAKSIDRGKAFILGNQRQRAMRDILGISNEEALNSLTPGLRDFLKKK